MALRRQKTRSKRRSHRRSIKRRRRIFQSGGSKGPTWVILQYDNRNLSYEFKQLVRVNRQYAERHGYDYIFDSKSYPIPPYWIKVKLTQDLLKEMLPDGRPKYKGVMFIDTDAVIVKPEVTLDTLSTGDKDFFAAADINYDLYPQDQSVFNAGIFIVKNTPKAHALFRDWMAVYDKVKDYWIFNGTTWHTNGNWAGPVYEQGAFVNEILPRHKDTIKLVDKYILQAQYVPQVEPIRPETFTIHFSHVRKNLQLPTFLLNELPKLQQN